MQTNPKYGSQHKIIGLYAIADTEILAGKDIHDCVEQAILGGASLVQLRDKTADATGRKDIAVMLKKLCVKNNTCFIINDDAELARAVNADGVHLGRDDMSIMEAREIVGEQKIIGASCYNQLAIAEAAQHKRADYVAFGSFYQSVTKPEAVSASLELVAEAVNKITLPIVAIGGINPDNAPPLIEAGVSAIAVASGIFGKQDIRAAAAEYCKVFN